MHSSGVAKRTSAEEQRKVICDDKQCTRALSPARSRDAMLNGMKAAARIRELRRWPPLEQ
jgi:hypothetical protein